MKISIQTGANIPSENDFLLLIKSTNINIPIELKSIISKYGDGKFSPNNHIIFNQISVDYFLSIKETNKNSINEALITYKDRIRENMIPIANCVGGNMLLIDEKGSIYFWDHEYENQDDLMAACIFISSNINDVLDNLEPLQDLKNAKVLSIKIDADFAKKMNIKIPPSSLQ